MFELKTKISILLMITLPVGFASLYLFLSRIPVRWFSETTDYVALFIAVIIGLIPLITLRLSILKTSIVSFFYAPLAAGALGIYSLYFVCIVFRDCL